MECFNFCRYQRHREINDKFSLKFQRQLHVTRNLINRLGLEVELEGHSGCVNCLEWNSRGDLLASGSDDQNIVLWNPNLHKNLLTLSSGHYGNIFSVKFLPNSNDYKIISGAADFKVKVHDIVEQSCILCCSCHGGRVKRIGVTPSEPNMFWSAAEDGVIMQYDVRIPHQCSNICNNVLVNLTHHLGRVAEAKCVTINAFKPHLLAVGANDPFVRVYDRRMIKITSATYLRDQSPGFHDNPGLSPIIEPGENNLPPDCVAFFVAGHLPSKQIEYLQRYRTLTVTYLAFSPDGNELLANLGGEQLYLFNLQTKERQILFEKMKIKMESDRAASSEKNNSGSSDKSISNTHFCVDDSISCYGDYHKTTCHMKRPSKYLELKIKAVRAFEKQEYTTAISFYSEAIILFPKAVSLYGNRALVYCNRAWDSDFYAALRDCYYAVILDPMYLKGHCRLAFSLSKLNLVKEAMECLTEIRLKFPDFAQSQQFELLENEIKVKWFAKMERDQARANRPCGPDTKELVSAFEKDCYVTDQEKRWRASAWDYESRFCGHCNVTTDIKEANFFGNNGQYIVAGSDDGSIFIWDRITTNIVRVLRGDESIVNCIQPHPSSCLLATSGIDHVVRLWGPKMEDGSEEDREVHNLEEVTAANQRRMDADPLEIMLLNMGYRMPSSPRSYEREQARYADDDYNDDDDEEEEEGALQAFRRAIFDPYFSK